MASGSTGAPWNIPYPKGSDRYALSDDIAGLASQVAASLSSLDASVDAHTHDDRYYRKAETDARDAAVAQVARQHTDTSVYAARQAAQEYTDTSFAASGPGGATDAQIDAGIDRAIASGRLDVRHALNAAEQGVVGDGTTDDTAAFHAAAVAAASAGIPLVLAPGMRVGIASWKRLPDGLTLYTEGATFVQLAIMSRAPLLSPGSRTRISGGLNLETLADPGTQGVDIRDATDVQIDSIQVTASAPGTGFGNIRNNGLTIIRAARVNVGRVYIKNYDWPIYADAVADASFDWIETDGYCKAIHLEDVQQFRINGGHVHGTSPNDAYLPGYNGLLMETTVGSDDVHIRGLLVEDAGEHGVRISGPALQRNVWLSDCTARRSGGSGFKILGGHVADGIYNDTITLSNPVADDSGIVNLNACGFLIQMCHRVRITNPIVQHTDNPYSARAGIRISGVKHLTITNPLIIDSNSYAILVDETRGDVEDLTITGARIHTGSGQGIYLQNAGVTFRGLHIDAAMKADLDGGAMFYTGVGTGAGTEGGWEGLNLLSLRHEGVGATVHGNASAAGLAAFTASIVGAKDGDPAFRGGSTWTDTTSGQLLVRKGSAWVAV